jgi:hypothetical protein
VSVCDRRPSHHTGSLFAHVCRGWRHRAAGISYPGVAAVHLIMSCFVSAPVVLLSFEAAAVDGNNSLSRRELTAALLQPFSSPSCTTLEHVHCTTRCTCHWSRCGHGCLGDVLGHVRPRLPIYHLVSGTMCAETDSYAHTTVSIRCDLGSWDSLRNLAQPLASSSQLP